MCLGTDGELSSDFGTDGCVDNMRNVVTLLIGDADRGPSEGTAAQFNLRTDLATPRARACSCKSSHPRWRCRSPRRHHPDGNMRAPQGNHPVQQRHFPHSRPTAVQRPRENPTAIRQSPARNNRCFRPQRNRSHELSHRQPRASLVSVLPIPRLWSVWALVALNPAGHRIILLIRIRSRHGLECRDFLCLGVSRVRFD